MAAAPLPGFSGGVPLGEVLGLLAKRPVHYVVVEAPRREPVLLQHGALLFWDPSVVVAPSVEAACVEEPQLVDRVLGALLAPGTWTGSLPAAAPADAGTAPLLPGPCTPEMLDFRSLAPSRGSREGAEQDERAAAHLEEQRQNDLGDETKHNITKLAGVKLQAPGNLERA